MTDTADLGLQATAIMLSLVSCRKNFLTSLHHGVTVSALLGSLVGANGLFARRDG
jgi:hypothetical protein